MSLTQGPMAFYRGFWTYYVRIAPHAMITLYALENLEKFAKVSSSCAFSAFSLRSHCSVFDECCRPEASKRMETLRILCSQTDCWKACWSVRVCSKLLSIGFLEDSND